MPPEPGPVPRPRSVAEVLDAPLAAAPDREALVARSGRWTYAELDRLANRAAHALAALGVHPGDRVGCSLPNDVDIVVAFHAAMRLGAVWVGVNRMLAPPERAHILEDSGASLFLADPAIGAGGSGVHTIPVGTGVAGEWADALHAAADHRPEQDVDPFAPAAIAYTSGTTGRPKGVVHSQHNLVVPGAATVAHRGWGPGLRKGDMFALTILNLQALSTVLVPQAGGCAVLMDRSDAAGVAEWIRRERVTVWNGPPALFWSLAHDDGIDPAALSSLDEAWHGGGDCPEPVRDAFERRFGPIAVATYGLTEAPSLVAIDDPGRHVPGASGRPLPHLTLPIVEGEICVAAVADGPWAGVYRPMLGYWRQPAATAEAVRDGRLHTGDLGFVDAEGHLHVRDRKSLLIIRGGGNVYPAEVERVLHELDDVEACAVIGLPDERLGERVAAVVQLRPGASLSEEELRAHCLASLARYKVPERWRFVDELPRNSMAKIRRRELAPLFD